MEQTINANMQDDLDEKKPKKEKKSKLKKALIIIAIVFVALTAIFFGFAFYGASLNKVITDSELFDFSATPSNNNEIFKINSKNDGTNYFAIYGINYNGNQIPLFSYNSTITKANSFYFIHIYPNNNSNSKVSEKEFTKSLTFPVTKETPITVFIEIEDEKDVTVYKSVRLLFKEGNLNSNKSSDSNRYAYLNPKAKIN